MARPKKIRLDDMNKETIEQNHLVDSTDLLPINKKVVVAQEVPKYERIVFINNRDPGCTLYFHYSSKTHPLKMYTVGHGMEYNLPVEVIRHLEGQNPMDPYSCHSRIYGERKNHEGLPETYVSGYKPYFQCRSVRT